MTTTVELEDQISTLENKIDNLQRENEDLTEMVANLTAKVELAERLADDLVRGLRG